MSGDEEVEFAGLMLAGVLSFLLGWFYGGDILGWLLL